jgi:hypothetical protein
VWLTEWVLLFSAWVAPHSDLLPALAKSFKSADPEGSVWSDRYQHPVDLTPIVDLDLRRVIRVDAYETPAEVNMEPNNYHRKYVGCPAEDRIVLGGDGGGRLDAAGQSTPFGLSKILRLGTLYEACT